MIPITRILGYRVSVYTKVCWILGGLSGAGSFALFLMGLTAWGWASLILGTAFISTFVYCAGVDHDRWCPKHGTEKEEEAADSGEV